MSVLPFLRRRECGENKHKTKVQHLLESKAADPALNQPCQLLGNARSTFLMDFSADRRKIASTHGDHSVRVTDISTGKCTHVLKGHPRTPWCLAFHPSSNQILASGCLGGEVRIWDLLGGGSEVFRSPCESVIASMAFHPSDHVLVFATSNTLYFWDWSKPEPFICCKTKEEYERIRWVRFCPLGHNLYTGIANGSTIQRSETSHPSQASDRQTDSRYDSRQRRLHQRYRTLLSRYQAYQSSRPPDNARQTARGGVPVLQTESSQEDHDILAMRPPSPSNEDTYDVFAAQALRNSRAYAATVTQDARRTMLFERHGLNRPIPHGPELQARLRSSREGVRPRQLPAQGITSPPPRREDLSSSSRRLAEPVSHTDALSLADTARDLSSIQRPLFVNTSDYNRDRSQYLLGSDTALAGAWGNSFRESLTPPVSINSTSSHSLRDRPNLESSLVDVWSNAVRQSAPSPSGSTPGLHVPSLNSPTAHFRHSPSGQASSPGGTSILRSRLNAAQDNNSMVFQHSSAATSYSTHSSTPVVIFGREESAWTPSSSTGSSHIRSPMSGPIVTHSPSSGTSGNLHPNSGQSEIQSSSTTLTRTVKEVASAKRSENLSPEHSLTSKNNTLHTDSTSSAKNICSTISQTVSSIVTQPNILMSTVSLAKCASTFSKSTDNSVVASPSNDEQTCSERVSTMGTSGVDGIKCMNSSRDIVERDAPCDSSSSDNSSNLSGLSTHDRYEIDSTAMGEGTPTDSLNSANLKNDQIGVEISSDNSSAVTVSRTSISESSGSRENSDRLVSVSRRNDSFSNSSCVVGNSSVPMLGTHTASASGFTRELSQSPTANSLALTSDCFSRSLGLMPITSSSVVSASSCSSRNGSTTRASSYIATTPNPISGTSGISVSVTSSASLSRAPPDLSLLGFRRIPSEALLSTSVLPVVSTTNTDLGVGISDPQDLPLPEPSGRGSSRFNCDNLYQRSERAGALPDADSLSDNNTEPPRPLTNRDRPVVDLHVVDSNDEHSRIRDMTSRLAQEINVLGRMIEMRERFSVRLQAIQQERNEAMANSGSTGLSRSPVARIPDITITQYQGESPAVPSTSAHSGPLRNDRLQESPAREVVSRGGTLRESPPDPSTDDLQAPPESALQGLDRTWRTLQRRHLHPHYGVSILDETINRPNDALQAAINRAIAGSYHGAFMGTGEAAVASNIINLTHRIQCWDFSKCLIPDISNAKCNIVVPYCKIHNDASCDISQDSSYLATFVPGHRGFPDDIILAVFSLLPSNRGDCLFTKSFGPNAISVSISPLKTHLVVGLASRRLSLVYTASQVVGQVYKLTEAKAGESSMEATADIHHSCDLDLQPNISVNSVRWLPEVGEGIAYGTNKGDLHICRPGTNMVLEKEDSEVGILQAEDISNNNNNMNNSRIRHNLMFVSRINTEIQTLMHSSQRTAATQTDQLAQSQQGGQSEASTSRNDNTDNGNITNRSTETEDSSEIEANNNTRNLEESMVDQ